MLGAPPRSPVFETLLQNLPRLLNNTIARAVRMHRPIDEWRVGGPEAWNRAVVAASTPLLMLPTKWIYPYDPERLPPPMETVARDALMWGEAKRTVGSGSWPAKALWNQLNAHLDQLSKERGVDVRDKEPSALQQCVWSRSTKVPAWKLVSFENRTPSPKPKLFVKWLEGLMSWRS